MNVSFSEAIRTCIEGIPRGRVATCGTVARALGDARAANAVAEWLREHPDLAEGHRVVLADGRTVQGEASRLLGTEGLLDSKGHPVRERFLETLPEVPLFRQLREEQERLASRIVESDPQEDVDTYGGADVSYEGDRAFAVAVTIDAQSLEPVEIAIRETEVGLPYVPTYLAFREFPAIEAAVHHLSRRPDVLFIDGHGRLHPRHFGFACYAGILLDTPTVGIAKHLLVGKLGSKRHANQDALPIQLDGEVLGLAWRPPRSSRPVYISVGNHVSLEGALNLTRRATKEKYPEPLRIADRISKEKKKKKNAERSASEQTARSRPPAQGPPGV